MAKLEVKPENHKIFVFKKIYEFESAKQQAEKKKVNAFGLKARFNLFKRPTDENVSLKEHMLRYEPFWFIESNRTLNYLCETIYNVPVHNPHAKSVSVKSTLDAQESDLYPVHRQKDKGKADIPIMEHCHRVIEYSNYFDGLKREIKSETLNNYIKKFSHDEVALVDMPNTLQPLLTVDTLTSIIRSKLQNESINASSIEKDSEEITALYLYFRPVYAFEYVLSYDDEIGIIEVDGLTGEIIENGSWFKNTFEQAFTRENLIELSAELASTVVPGAGTAIKIANKIITN